MKSDLWQIVRLKTKNDDQFGQNVMRQFACGDALVVESTILIIGVDQTQSVQLGKTLKKLVREIERVGQMVKDIVVRTSLADRPNREKTDRWTIQNGVVERMGGDRIGSTVCRVTCWWTKEKR